MNQESQSGGVFRGVTVYHWVVVLIASAAWAFDCMDARLFVLARQSALEDLLKGASDAILKTDAMSQADAMLKVEAMLKTYGGYATTALILGWATGGILFGIMSDRLGRVKTMAAALLTYSIFTGLSGVAVSWTDFMIYRFIVGLGVGGLCGAATTLIAETVPDGFRPLALGALQFLAIFGNMGGSFVSYYIQPGAEDFLFGYAGWRVLFFVGILPAFLVVPIVGLLKEPRAWLDMRAASREGKGGDTVVGSPIELFRHRRWRRNTIIGLFLGLSGMSGLWAVGFFSPELITDALKGQPQKYIDEVRAIGMMRMDLGAFFGTLTFTIVASFLNRRIAFLGAFILSFFTTVLTFNYLNSESDVYWMMPMMGFAQFSLFAGYSIYFPELFPTKLRGVGVGFCYNTVRYLAAPAPILLGWLTMQLSAHYDDMAFRYAASIMACVYLVGAVTLIWAPETKGKPLPED